MTTKKRKTKTKRMTRLAAKTRRRMDVEVTGVAGKPVLTPRPGSCRRVSCCSGVGSTTPSATTAMKTMRKKEEKADPMRGHLPQRRPPLVLPTHRRTRTVRTEQRKGKGGEGVVAGLGRTLLFLLHAEQGPPRVLVVDETQSSKGLAVTVTPRHHHHPLLHRLVSCPSITQLHHLRLRPLLHCQGRS